MLRYVERSSFLHSLDSRVKLLWLVFFIILAVSSDMAVAASLSLFVLALYPVARISAFRMLSENWLLVLFALFPFVLRAVFEKGTTTILGIALPLGMWNGALNALYLFSIFFASLLFIFTTRVSGIRDALMFFRMPLDLALMFTIALQAVPLLQRKINSVRIAQASRGGKGALSLVIPILHAVFRKAQKMAISMEARGFDPEHAKVRSCLKMKAMDWLAFLVLFIFALIFAASRLGIVTIKAF